MRGGQIPIGRQLPAKREHPRRVDSPHPCKKLSKHQQTNPNCRPAANEKSERDFQTGRKN